jgi:hypothetical protein
MCLIHRVRRRVVSVVTVIGVTVAIALVSADDPAVTPIDDLLLRSGQHVQQLQEQWAVVIGD